jgi:hypothetical protein
MKKLVVQFERVKCTDIRKETLAFAERGAIGTSPETVQEMTRLAKRIKDSKEIQASAKATIGHKVKCEYLASLSEN